MKYVFIFVLTTLTTLATGKPSHPGNITQLELEYPKKSEDIFQNSLNRTNTSYGPFLRLLKIHSASISTSKKVNADFLDQYGNVKNCDVVILNRPSFANGRKSIFNCAD